MAVALVVAASGGGGVGGSGGHSGRPPLQKVEAPDLPLMGSVAIAAAPPPP